MKKAILEFFNHRVFWSSQMVFTPECNYRRWTNWFLNETHCLMRPYNEAESFEEMQKLRPSVNAAA